MSVFNGDSNSHFKISKKHMIICYHGAREDLAAGIWRVWFVKGKHIIADFLTNILYGTTK